jgi:type I restriction enzyme S subunit
MTKDDLFSLKVVRPIYPILILFHEAINPMFINMNILEQENQALASLRDFLLPVLMNGQVTINTAKRSKK